MNNGNPPSNNSGQDKCCDCNTGYDDTICTASLSITASSWSLSLESIEGVNRGTGIPSKSGTGVPGNEAFTNLGGRCGNTGGNKNYLGWSPSAPEKTIPSPIQQVPYKKKISNAQSKQKKNGKSCTCTDTSDGGQEQKRSPLPPEKKSMGSFTKEFRYQISLECPRTRSDGTVEISSTLYTYLVKVTYTKTLTISCEQVSTSKNHQCCGGPDGNKDGKQNKKGDEYDNSRDVDKQAEDAKP